MTTRPMPSSTISEDIILISSDSENETTTSDTKPSCLVSKSKSPSDGNQSNKEDVIENKIDTNGTTFTISKKSANGLSIEENSINIDNLFEKVRIVNCFTKMLVIIFLFQGRDKTSRTAITI